VRVGAAAIAAALVAVLVACAPSGGSPARDAGGPGAGPAIEATPRPPTAPSPPPSGATPGAQGLPPIDARAATAATPPRTASPDPGVAAPTPPAAPTGAPPGAPVPSSAPTAPAAPSGPVPTNPPPRSPAIYAEHCDVRAQDNYRTNETFAIDPRNPSTLYVGVEYRGMFKSTDRGATWFPISSGLRGYPLRSDQSSICILEMGRTIVDPTNPQRLLMIRVDSPGTLRNAIAENAGLYESLDGGASWHQILADWMNAGGGHALAIDPANPRTVYYGSANFIPRYAGSDGRPVNTKGVLYKTTDGGRSWIELPTGLLPDLSAARVAVDPDAPRRVLLATSVVPKGGAQPGTYAEFGIMLSEDGGFTWTSWADRLPLEYRGVIAMSASRGFRHIIVLGQSPTFAQRAYVSTDGGATFRAPTRGVTIAAFSPHDPNGSHVIGVAASEVVESRDGGATWTTLGPIPPEVNRALLNQVERLTALVFDPVDPSVVYLTGAPAAVWRSTDGGRTWTAILTLERLRAFPLPRAAG